MEKAEDGYCDPETPVTDTNEALLPCPTCAAYRKFIQAMVKEFGKYGENKTATYYKGQCEKILEQTADTDKGERR